MKPTAVWWRQLTAAHWRVLFASSLGWSFDGYELYTLVLVLGPMLTTLLPPAQRASLPFWAGLAIAITLLGWGIGGLIGSTLADYIGRKRMMVYSVVGYALFAGLTALSQDYWTLVALRLLTGLFLGSEWSTGVTLLAETWPDEARPKGAGILQSALGWGTLLASLVWFLLNPLGPQAWRLMFVVGVTPALFALYIRNRLDESERWADAVRRGRWGATGEDVRALEAAGRVGAAVRRPFTLAAIFRQRESRRRVVLSLLLSLSTMIGWWAISSWLPTYAQALARAEGFSNLAYWGSIAGLLYNAGAIVGYTISGFVADAIGRRAYLILMYAGSLLLTPVTYLWVHSLSGFLLVVAVNGFFTLAQYSWFAVYLPELFTSTVRSTAIGFVFNASRLVAWLGPLTAGSLIQYFGGISKAAVAFGFVYVLGLAVAPFMPETRGQPLPE